MEYCAACRAKFCAKAAVVKMEITTAQPSQLRPPSRGVVNHAVAACGPRSVAGMDPLGPREISRAPNPKPGLVTAGLSVIESFRINEPVRSHRHSTYTARPPCRH